MVRSESVSGSLLPLTSSGISPQEEYLRSIGALFAVYWLARIGIDGECGFCFGVDREWRPVTPDAIAASSSAWPSVASSINSCSSYG